MLLKRALSICIVVIVLMLGVSQAVGEQRSFRRALLYSLVLPGAGQLYLGNTTRAKVMLVAEVSVWTGFGFYRLQGKMREERYKQIARLFAGVEREMDDEYYKILAYYPSSREYNIDVMREARNKYKDDRDKQMEYFHSHGYFGEDSWEWQDLSMQEEFRRTRILSRRSYRRSVLTTGFALLNRLVSVLDVYLYMKLNRRPEAPRLGMHVDDEGKQYFYVQVPF